MNGSRATPDGGAELSVGTVLVPVDGSDGSVRASEYAVAIGDRYGADLHLVYVHDAEVVRAIEADRIDEAAVSAEASAFLDDLCERAAEATVAATTSTAFGFSTRRKARHPGSVVLDTAGDVGADFLVVPRDSATGEEGTVLEKAAEYVLLYASQPVLSV